MSGLGIIEMMMNIMSCNDSSKLTISIVTITCCSALVPYYLSKGFLLFKKKKVKFKIYQNKFSRKSILLHYMTKTAFWRVKQKYHPFSNLEQIVTPIDVYDNFQYRFHDERHVKPYNKQFQFLSCNLLTNLNIQPSSLNGLIIWTHLLI